MKMRNLVNFTLTRCSYLFLLSYDFVKIKELGEPIGYYFSWSEELVEPITVC